MGHPVRIIEALDGMGLCRQAAGLPPLPEESRRKVLALADRDHPDGERFVREMASDHKGFAWMTSAELARYRQQCGEGQVSEAVRRRVASGGSDLMDRASWEWEGLHTDVEVTYTSGNKLSMTVFEVLTWWGGQRNIEGQKLWLVGPTRVGKTYAAALILRLLSDGERARNPLYLRSVDLGETLRYSRKEELDAWSQADALLLDDLFREARSGDDDPGERWRSRFYGFVDGHTVNRTPLIITANGVSTAELTRRYGEPAAKRLTEGATVVRWPRRAASEVTA